MLQITFCFMQEIHNDALFFGDTGDFLKGEIFTLFCSGGCEYDISRKYGMYMSAHE